MDFSATQKEVGLRTALNGRNLHCRKRVYGDNSVLRISNNLLGAIHDGIRDSLSQIQCLIVFRDMNACDFNVCDKLHTAVPLSLPDLGSRMRTDRRHTHGKLPPILVQTG